MDTGKQEVTMEQCSLCARVRLQGQDGSWTQWIKGSNLQVQKLRSAYLIACTYVTCPAHCLTKLQPGEEVV